MRKLLVLILFSYSFIATYCQGSIKGRIIDSSTKKTLSFATVTVFKAADTALILASQQRFSL